MVLEGLLFACPRPKGFPVNPESFPELSSVATASLPVAYKTPSRVAPPPKSATAALGKPMAYKTPSRVAPPPKTATAALGKPMAYKTPSRVAPPPKSATTHQVEVKSLASERFPSKEILPDVARSIPSPQLHSSRSMQEQLRELRIQNSQLRQEISDLEHQSLKQAEGYGYGAGRSRSIQAKLWAQIEELESKLLETRPSNLRGGGALAEPISKSDGNLDEVLRQPEIDHADDLQHLQPSASPTKLLELALAEKPSGFICAAPLPSTSISKLLDIVLAEKATKSSGVASLPSASPSKLLEIALAAKSGKFTDCQDDEKYWEMLEEPVGIHQRREVIQTTRAIDSDEESCIDVEPNPASDSAVVSPELDDEDHLPSSPGSVKTSSDADILSEEEDEEDYLPSTPTSVCSSSEALIEEGEEGCWATRGKSPVQSDQSASDKDESSWPSIPKFSTQEDSVGQATCRLGVGEQSESCSRSPKRRKVLDDRDIEQNITWDPYLDGADGVHDFSADDFIDCISPATLQYPPSQPGQLTATALNSRSCLLCWSASVDDGGVPIEKFLVHAVPKDPGFVHQCAEVPFQEPSSGEIPEKHAKFTRISKGYVVYGNCETRLLFSGLDPTRYLFQMQAVNRIGASACSAPVDVDLSLKKSSPSDGRCPFQSALHAEWKPNILQ